MSWDSFYDEFKKLAGKTAVKINRSTDIASLQVKHSAKKRKLEEAYTELGKASYLHFMNAKNVDADRITAATEQVTKLRGELATLKGQIDAKKKEAADEAAREKAEKAARDAERKARQAEEAARAAEEAQAEEAARNGAECACRKADPTCTADSDLCMNVSISTDPTNDLGAVEIKKD